MKRYYCTYFDRNYLVRAIALIESLNKHEKNDFQLFAVCHDEISRIILKKLNFPNVTIVPMHKIEQGDAPLVTTKKTRSLVEYYWTAGPTVILWLLEHNPGIDVLTYIDADLFFFSSPDPIFSELCDNSVLIHEHRFPPSLMHLEVHGKYNVGLLCFRNDEIGLKVLNRWRQQCIEWCYVKRSQDGKFADQVYLNDWPRRFEHVTVLQNVGAGVAPWNHTQYTYSVDESNRVFVNGTPLVFYHFHELKFISPDVIVPFTHYPLLLKILKVCYLQYVYALSRGISAIQSVLPDFTFGLDRQVPLSADYTFLAKHELSANIKEFGIGQTPAAVDDNWDCYCSNRLVYEHRPSQPTSQLSIGPLPLGSVSSNNTRLTIATSIALKNLAKQGKAVESWMKLGFDVVSINCAEEIQKLQGAFPNVRFIQAKRDAREMFGKPLVYFDEFLEYFSRTGSEFCGIVNSDVFLFSDEGIISFIKEHAKGSLVYGSRMEVDSLEVLVGDVYEDGFDFFFFDKSLVSCFPKSDFCIGMPWWDYWMPLIPALEKIQIKKLVSGFAYHLKHRCKWNAEYHDLLAKRFWEHLRRRIDENFHSDPDSNPWALLAKIFLAYQRRDLMKNNRKDSDKLSIGIISPCIIDFLKLKSSRIYCPNSGLTDKREGKDIFVHKTKPIIQEADNLRAEYEVSIVLCTKGRAEMLDRMLASLKAAAGREPYEVIVVEGGSSDNTLDVLRKRNITKLYSESEWLGQGKHSWPQLYNFGFSKASGKWGMYASDDIVFSKGCISEAISLLNRQSNDVAGGVFFYKNVYPANPEWANFGIDFTHGQKLLMNYGLVRLDYFRQVGGLEDVYQFYCADSDFCYKLYEAGMQLIPLPSSFIAHDNVLDAQKQANYSASDRDIELLQRRWKHFVPAEIPDPRRLTWQEDLFEAFNLPDKLEKINSGIESFWHGLAYFQHGLFEKAKSKFIQAIESRCEHWMVYWLLAKAAYQCGDKALAEKMVLQVQNLAPAFGPAKDFLNQLGAEARGSAELLQCRTESENRLSPAETGTERDIIGLIFSKDRAMQLRAALESFFLHCADSEQIKLFVLYQVSNQLHQRQYNNLKKDFGNVVFIKETNFKQQLLAVVEGSEYVLFLVDDNLFVKDFYLADVVKSLRENKDSIGFSLRLGKKTNYCYSHDSKQSLPAFHKIDNGILKYNWTAGEYDFGYPLELSSSLYKTSDILVLLDKLEFTNPNVLEDMMAANAQLYAQTKGCLLCYENSVAFCNPINKVQSVWNNRSCTDDRYSAEKLAEMFEEGVRIDVEKFSGFVPSSCHQEVQVYFKAEDREP